MNYKNTTIVYYIIVIAIALSIGTTPVLFVKLTQKEYAHTKNTTRSTITNGDTITNSKTVTVNKTGGSHVR